MAAEDEVFFLANHRAHDYEHVVEGWRKLATSFDLKVDVFAEEGGHPVLEVSNGLETSRERGLYLSAGVHGDEPAAVMALLAWAGRRGDFLERYPVTIFPCLNPRGLLDNTRHDHEGRDLNRSFEMAEVGLIGRWQSVMRGREFRYALNLHEDYDAQGVYVYELARCEASLGEVLLRACEDVIPRYPGTEVDGTPAENGLIRRDTGIEEIADEIDGMPEAIYLWMHHAEISMTFETPSEYSLYRRVQAQEAALDALVGLVENEHP